MTWLKNPDLVFDKAEEMAEKYREQLLKKAQEAAAQASGDDDAGEYEEETFSDSEE